MGKKRKKRKERKRKKRERKERKTYKIKDGERDTEGESNEYITHPSPMYCIQY